MLYIYFPPLCVHESRILLTTPFTPLIEGNRSRYIGILCPLPIHRDGGQETSRLPQSRFRDTIQNSRGKFDNFRRTPAEFTTLDFVIFSQLVQPELPHIRFLSVPGAPGLHASLEPCLTAALLRFANTSPPSGCVEDLTSAQLSRSLTSKLSNMLGTLKKGPRNKS